MNGRQRRGARAALALALGTLAGCGGASTPPSARSVLLVTLDTTRADALSCYGARMGTTPEIDALAREGVLYERAFTTAPITLTAHASLLTGLYPPRHGLRDNGLAALAPSARTLAEAAHEAGIQTAAFVGAIVLDESLGLDQGFDVYDGPVARRSTSGHPTERPAPAVIDAALAWLADRDPTRPFFLWVHLYDAHHPYEPRHAPAEGASALERYLAEVHETDAELGRLLARLRESGALEETLVCVTADHGEAFGEHQELTHGAFAWNTTLLVPLVLRFPGGWRAGERATELASLVDLAPTLAQALGVSLGADIDGRSLLAPRPEPGLYFESYSTFIAFAWSPLSGWIDDGGKYLHSSRPEFFDLAADPDETRDLVHERGARLEPYRAAIAAVAGRPVLGTAAGVIDSALQEGIRGLGYAAFDSTGGVLPHPLEATSAPSPHAMVGVWRESMVAQELLNQGRVPAAIELLRRLASTDPKNAFLRMQLATGLMRAKQHQEAMDALRPLLDAAVVQPQVFYKLGVCAQKLGRREEAVRFLERAAELAPDEPRYRTKLAQVQSGAESDVESGADE